MGFGFKIEGMEEAVRAVQRLRSSIDVNDVERVMLKGARIVRDDAKLRARLGPTGNLKKGIRAKKSRQGRLIAAAFAAVDFKVARHGYLLEYGTVRMAPRPYFRPAVDATREEVEQVVTEGIRDLVMRAVR